MAGQHPNTPSSATKSRLTSLLMLQSLDERGQVEEHPLEQLQLRRLHGQVLTEGGQQGLQQGPRLLAGAGEGPLAQVG